MHLFLQNRKAERCARRRGAVSSLFDDVDELLVKAHKQALRARQYVESVECAEFFDARANALVAVRRSEINHFFLLNVTLDDLGPISSQLSSLKRLNVLDGRTWPWSVSLADFLTVYEVLDTPSLFLHYLFQRVPLNDERGLRVFDELDLVMRYLEQSLFTRPGNASQEATVLIGSHTGELDKYFFRREQGLVATKPARKVHPELTKLLSAIENLPSDAAASCIFALLDCDEETRETIGNRIEQAEIQTRADGDSHSLTLVFKDEGFVLLLANDLRDWTNDRAASWARWSTTRHGVDRAVVIVWKYPLSSGVVRTWLFE